MKSWAYGAEANKTLRFRSLTLSTLYNFYENTIYGLYAPFWNLGSAEPLNAGEEKCTLNVIDKGRHNLLGKVARLRCDRRVLLFTFGSLILFQVYTNRCEFCEIWKCNLWSLHSFFWNLGSAGRPFVYKWTLLDSKRQFDHRLASYIASTSDAHLRVPAHLLPVNRTLEFSLKVLLVGHIGIAIAIICTVFTLSHVF